MRDKASEGWLHHAKERSRCNPCEIFITPQEKVLRHAHQTLPSTEKLVATHSHKRKSSRDMRGVEDTTSEEKSELFMQESTQTSSSVNWTDNFVLIVWKSTPDIRSMKRREENKRGSIQNYKAVRKFIEMIVLKRFKKWKN